MEPEKPDSSFVYFAKRVEYIPRYLVDYMFGLMAAIVSDVIVTTIALASVALGLAIGHWLLVVALFFTLYAVLRIVSIIANAIGNSGQIIGASMRQSIPAPGPPTGQIFPGDQAQPSPSVEEVPRVPITLPPA